MKKHGVLVLILLVIGLSACGGEEAADVTPTGSGTSNQPAASTPQQVQLAMLDLNPAAYDGDLVEVMGRLSFRPRIVCSGEVQESPATWQLTADDATIFVGGFDEQVRLLLHEEQTMRVVGRWTRWQGPVGCDDSAKQEQIRYLEVTKILWPSPLTNATLTPNSSQPDSGGTAVAEETDTGNDNETETAVTHTPTSTPTPDPDQPLAGDATATATATPEGRPSPTAVNTATPGGSTGFPTATPSATATSTPTTDVTTPGPGTPSATPTAVASATATATTPSGNSSGTATPTPTPLTTFTLINQGQIDPEELSAGALKQREIHSFSFILDDNDEVTLLVAGEPALDLVVSIGDEFGSKLVEIDNQMAGGIEQIDNLPLAEGSYTIQVREKSGEAGSYMLMLMVSDSYAYSFMDVISYGQSVSGNTAEENDHFWLFYGETGDVITITAVSSNMGDLFLELYDPSANNVSDFIDEGLEGEPEILSRFTLANSGLFAIRVGEYEFNPMTYQLIVTKEE